MNRLKCATLITIRLSLKVFTPKGQITKCHSHCKEHFVALYVALHALAANIHKRTYNEFLSQRVKNNFAG